MFPVSAPRIFKNARRPFVTESLFSTVNLYILQLCRKLYTCIGIFQEVPLLFSYSTGCNATKKQTPNYISGNVLLQLWKISRKNSLTEFLLSNLQAYKLQL